MTEVIVKGHRILAKPHFDEEEIKEGALKGFKMDVGETFQREKAATIVAEVVDIGSTAWYAYDRYLPDGSINPDWEPWCEVGDIIYFARHAGKFITVDDETMMLLNDADVIAVRKED